MTLDQAAFKQLIELGIPYNAFLGIKLVHMAPGECDLLLPFRPEFLGDARHNAMHGGVLSTLVDVCGGFTVWSKANIEDRIATIDLRVDYLRPVPGEDILARGRLRLMGNRVGNAQVEIVKFKDQEKILAEGRGVYNIRKK